jgi:diguanylate cyclase (GGDEF)-like protein/PAS domain S-box-containing protein
MNFTHIHKAILDCMSEAVYVVDRDMKILYTNPAAATLTEYSDEEAIGAECHKIFCERSFRCEEVCPPQKAMREMLPLLHREAETKTKSGTVKQTQISISPFFENAMCVGAVIVIKDITKLRQAEKTIKCQNDFLMTVINSLPHPLLVINTENYRVQMANIAAHPDPLPEDATCYALSHGQPAPCNSEDHPCPMDYVRRSGKSLTMDHIHSDAEGNKQDVEVHCHPIFDPEGRIVQMIEYSVDISARKLFEERLEKMAFFDNLTGIPNRKLFFDRLAHSISLAKRNRQILALLFIDLDRFKFVNDNYGHITGDLMLIETARRLKSCTRESDTVARMGGDEFTIILTPIGEPGDAALFAGKVLKTISGPLYLAGHEFVVSASIGISLYPADGDTVETLLQKADIAMYRAKEERNNIYRFYAGEYNEND